MDSTPEPERPERGYWIRDPYYGELEWVEIPPARWYHYVIGAVAGTVALVIWFFIIWIAVFGAQSVTDWFT